MTYTISHFINGNAFTNPQAKSQDLINPATGKVTGNVLFATQSDIDQAIAAAKAALPEWSATSSVRRSRILFRFNALLNQHLDELAALISQEHGKTLADARGSVQRGIEVVEYACGIPNQLMGKFAADVAAGTDCYSLRQPLGICAGITPFNFPAMIGLWMFPIAIACGNTFIWKPSEKDPSVSVRLAELIHEAGLPKGVLNVVQGDKTAVDILLMHTDIEAISFVGSTPVAEYVYKTATANHKRVQAFGGAKNHCVVMPDANLQETADALVGAAYGSAGERCMAISVIVAVSDKVADELIKLMKPRIENLIIGAGNEEKVEMGPLISKAHLEKVSSYVELGIKEGAILVIDGRNYQNKNNPDGFYLGGSLFDHVTTNMKIYQDEIFGPVLCIARVASLDEAIELINSNPYGNGTAIFTRSGEIAHEFSHKVKVGMVGINVPIPVPVAYQSFGGWKRSIFSDIGMYGTEGIQFYTKLKTITQHWPKQTSGSDFTIPTMK